MTVRTWCDRSASINSASVIGVIGVAASSTQRRRSTPSGVSPGSNVKCASCSSATRRAWVLLPLASIPSKTTKVPRSHHVVRVRRRDQRGVGLRALGDRGALGGAGRLLRRAPSWSSSSCGLLRAFLVAFVAFRGRVDGSAFRRSARSSQARSSVMRLGRVAESQRGVGLAVGHVEAEATGAHDDVALGDRVLAEVLQAAPPRRGARAAWAGPTARAPRRGRSMKIWSSSSSERVSLPHVMYGP